jgi:hypothetical protein
MPHVDAYSRLVERYDALDSAEHTPAESWQALERDTTDAIVALHGELVELHREILEEHTAGTFEPVILTRTEERLAVLQRLHNLSLSVRSKGN